MQIVKCKTRHDFLINRIQYAEESHFSIFIKGALFLSQVSCSNMFRYLKYVFALAGMTYLRFLISFKDILAANQALSLMYIFLNYVSYITKMI